MRYAARVGVWLLGSLAVSNTPASGGVAQIAQGARSHSSDRVQEPRFIRLVSETDAPAKLRHTVTLRADGWSLAKTLDDIARQLELPLIYDTLVTNTRQRITVRFDKVTGARAVLRVLDGTGLELQVAQDGSAARVRRGPKPHETSASDTTGSLVGRVTNAKTGVGVAGVEVFLLKTRWRTVTDTAGRYHLTQVDPGAHTLVVRRLGYAKQNRVTAIVADRMDTVDVALEPVATRLDELVTTATGRRRRMDIANDVTTINADSVMQAAPIRSVTDLLEGRVPGLTAQRTSGAPGDPSRLRLRGAGSPLRSNDPIVIVDGIRKYAEQSAARSQNLAVGNLNDGSRSGGYATPSPIDYIDPNSIETIEVLKGPSATTLYGQDAANGVIVITTKKGKAGPTRWSASVEQGRTQIAGDYPDLFLRWGHMVQSNLLAHCLTGNVTKLLSQIGQIGIEEAYSCEADSVVQFQLLNDPALTVLDRAHRTSASLGASGGSAALTYAVTGSYQTELGLPKLPDYEAARFLDRTGTPPPDWMQRPQHLTQWGVSSQFGARLGATADLGLSLNFTRTAQQRSDLEGQLGTLMSTYLDRASGVYYASTSTAYGDLGAAGNTTTGILTNYFTRVTDVATSFTNGLNFTWRPRNWFTLRADAGLNIDQRADELFLPRGASTRSDSLGNVAVGQGTVVESSVNVFGESQVPMGRGFHFRFTGGINYKGTSTKDQNLQTSHLAAGTSLMGATLDGGSRSALDVATFGWYLEPSVGNSKFSFTSGLRLDSGTGFGTSNRFPNPLTLFTNPLRFLKLAIPKLQFTYVLSEEPWFPLQDAIQAFRLRVAYGKSTRQPEITDRLRLYTGSQSVWGEGQFIDAQFLSTIGNTEVRPERATEFEGGFDIELLDSRLRLEPTVYRKTTHDALLPIPVAPSVNGGGSTVRNIGVTRNTGLDLTIEAQLVRSGPVTWQTRMWLSQRKDLVVKLADGVDPFYTNSVFSCKAGDHPTGCGGVRVAAGYPLFGRWSLPIAGYADANGNGVIAPNEFVLGDTAVYVGQTMPNYTAGLGSTVQLWHGALTVNVGFQYDNGLAQRNEVAQYLSAFVRAMNDPSSSLAEQAATFPVPGTDYNWIQVVNTLRFNSMSVNYRVPTVVARRLGAQQLNVALQGGNLGLWTNYRGLDPNVNAFATGNSVTDTGVLPQSRTWQLRVNATY